MDFKGATLAQYDQVIQRMGLVRGGPMPSGGLSHWVTETADGLHICDLWESREQFDTFAEEQIGPFSREAGIEQPPEVSFFEVHNYLLSPSAEVPAA